MVVRREGHPTEMNYGVVGQIWVEGGDGAAELVDYFWRSPLASRWRGSQRSVLRSLGLMLRCRRRHPPPYHAGTQ